MTIISERGTALRPASVAVPLALAGLLGALAADRPLLFDTRHNGEPPADGPIIQPWRTVRFDPAYAGAWVVAGDLDGDRQVEVLSARNVDRNDVHFTSAVAVHRLDGTILWRWGDPHIGRRKLHHDVACQIYDWDGDGTNEVVLCTEGALVELDGRTGQERRRLPLPKDATDCLVFANLSGNPRATDVLVKTRYTDLWAYTREGRLLWHVTRPAGHLTAHQPVPLDLDGDGRDEIMAGYALLNADGTVRWTLASPGIDLKRGHLDCLRVVRAGPNPAAFRLVATYCGANGIALLDGTGRTLWEIAGHHFESVDVGRVRADVPGLQLVVDIDHRPPGEGPIWVIDEEGHPLGQILTPYARHHGLLDWTGDGLDEIVVAEARGLFDGQGRRVATLALHDPAPVADPDEKLALVGDFTGDGVPDVALTPGSSSAVFIYRNEQGRKPSPPAPLGTGVNFTLY